MSEDRRPTYARTGEPIETEQPGYYPGYSTLGQNAYWDRTTRETVFKRVNQIPPIRFFTPEQARSLEAVADRLLPQDDRRPDRRIPIVNHIDDKLFRGEIDGYQYEDMPSDRDAMTGGIAAIDNAAKHLHARSFADLTMRQQEEILKAIHDGKPLFEDSIWQRMSVGRFWQLLLHFCIEAYYAHPWTWDEVGFGGPAYPRAYMRLEGGKPEPWECDEVRYEWNAPKGSLSDRYEKQGGEHGNHAPHGQEGTH